MCRGVVNLLAAGKDERLLVARKDFTLVLMLLALGLLN